MFVTGASQKPVYLWVKDGRGELRDAEHFEQKGWGPLAGESSSERLEELGLSALVEDLVEGRQTSSIRQGQKEF